MDKFENRNLVNRTIEFISLQIQQDSILTNYHSNQNEVISFFGEGYVSMAILFPDKIIMPVHYDMTPSIDNLENFINDQCRLVRIDKDNVNSSYRYCSNLIVPLNSQDENKLLEFMKKNAYLPIIKSEKIILPDAKQVYMKSYEHDD